MSATALDFSSSVGETLSGSMIGIVIPAFNAGQWIGDCLHSLIAQTRANWSAVVVDDGSTDDTVSRILEIEDARIQLVRQPNSGVSVARNHGVEALPECEAVLFLDADDWLAGDALERLADALENNPRAVAATGPAAIVRADGSIREVTPGSQGGMLSDLLIRNRCLCGQLLIRREAIRTAGPFLVTLSFGEDWEYWVRLALLGRFARAAGSEPLLFVRRMETGAFTRLMMRSPSSFERCIDAIFTNLTVQARVGPHRAQRLRNWAWAEVEWAIGCARLNEAEYEYYGQALLRNSFYKHPTPKRLALLVAAHFSPAWHALAPLRRQVTGVGYEASAT